MFSHLLASFFESGVLRLIFCLWGSMSKRKQKLELTWVGKDERPKLEPRILIEEPDLSYHADKRYGDDDIFDNMLIQADNLLALKALEQEYAGQVKCIYIDPPYNIDVKSPLYVDGLEHSIWLGLMRDRLEALKNLLDDGGIILVQIDKCEAAYLKVTMDEIFGRVNYITTVSLRMSKTSGFKIEHSDKTIVKNGEFIHIYSNGSFKLNAQFEKAEYDPHYSLFVENHRQYQATSKLVEHDFVSSELDYWKLRKSANRL